jgi:uncharacterized membrane protein YeaQ/YmgE (transglycosylase-associated protein family)
MAICIKKKQSRFLDIVCFTLVPCIIFILVICICGYYLFIVNNWLFKSQHDGFVGNFIGGIIGGIVAFIIAKFQLKIQQKENRNFEEKQSNAMFVSLKSELKFNLTLLKKIIDKISEFGIQAKFDNNIPFSISTWETIKLSAIFIEKIEEEQYYSLSDLYYELSMIKYLNFTKEEKAIRELHAKIEGLIEKYNV